MILLWSFFPPESNGQEITKNKFPYVGGTYFYEGKPVRIRENQLGAILKENPIAYQHWLTSKKYRRTQLIFVPLIIGSGAWTIASMAQGIDVIGGKIEVEAAPIFLLIASGISNLVMKSLGRKHLNKAIDLYNSPNQISWSVHFGTTKNGIGLSICF